MSGPVLDLAKPLALAAAIAVVAFEVGGFVLLGDVDFGPCLDAAGGRRARFVQLYICSPRLLGEGWREAFVFVWLWSFPALLALPLLHLFTRKIVSE